MQVTTQVTNDLDGKFAVHRDYLVVFPIERLRIEYRCCDDVVVTIQGKGSFWVRLSNCITGEKEDLEIWANRRQAENRLKCSYFSYLTHELE